MALRLNPHGPLVAIAATAAPLGAAAAQPPANPAFPCDAFQRQPLGAWTVLRAVTIAPEGETIDLPAGRTFTQDETIDGLELSAVLDRYCGNRQP